MDNTQSPTGTQQTESHATTSTKVAAGGSLLGASAAIATIALAIVGLAGALPTTMAAIAAIVAGAAALMQGGAFAARTAQWTSREEGQFAESASGMDFLGGLATIVLGILALLGIAPQTLLAIALIALGATLLLSGRTPIGLAAAVLGILAVVGMAQLTLILVGLLVVGAGLLFAGSQIAATALSARP